MWSIRTSPVDSIGPPGRLQLLSVMKGRAIAVGVSFFAMAVVGYRSKAIIVARLVAKAASLQKKVAEISVKVQKPERYRFRFPVLIFSLFYHRHFAGRE